MKKILTILIIAIVFATGCKKDDEVVDPEIQLAEDIIIIEAYLLQNDITATKTESGLFYIFDVQGEGTESPVVTSTVTIKYRGSFLNGKVFDQTYGNTTRTWNLSGLVEGMKEGIQLMHVGDEIRLFIPSGLAYGDKGQGSIAANAVLIFEVELISFTND